MPTIIAYRFPPASLVAAAIAACVAACTTEPPSLQSGLLVALAQFVVTASGKVTTQPGPARVDILTMRHGVWRVRRLEDPQSNVFHKAMPFVPTRGRPGILTFGGSVAAVKLWRPSGAGFRGQTLWQADFGGAHSRMRDAEVADLFEDGNPRVIVATHDQGVVALLRGRADDSFAVTEIDRQPGIYVHEVEVGDLDGDGVLEVYATRSRPNRLGGRQPGSVVRYVPARKQGRTVIADFGQRHAKEILVDDVDGDGRDELYVAVEAATTGSGNTLRIRQPVEIRRYVQEGARLRWSLVAHFDDRFCRFLTAGDVDGDGKKEIVVAPFSSGVWLLRPTANPAAPWTREQVDRDSSGFEHATLLADLDGNGRDELYVASDHQGELRRYLWQDGHLRRTTILRRPAPGAVITWNLSTFPVALLEGR